MSARRRHRYPGFATFVFAGLVLAGPASATTLDCMLAPDGTACLADCRSGGQCQGGKCVGGVALPDGIACATGDRCTQDDYCASGVCQAGRPRACPLRYCSHATCQQGLGCVYTAFCGHTFERSRDLGTMPDADTGGSDGGRAEITDAGGNVLADAALPGANDGGGTQGPGDGASAPTDGDADADGGSTTDDGAVGGGGANPDAFESLPYYLHVYGSGCSVAGRRDVPGDTSSASGLLGLLSLACLTGLALGPARRRRQLHHAGRSAPGALVPPSTRRLP